jgi:hypothetical protein
MIVKELFFKYNLNYLTFSDLILDNNDEFVKVIPEIVFYQKGLWKNNKRIDIIKINITDIPSDLKTIINLMKDNNGFIEIKIKIKKFFNDNNIILKTKFKLIGIIGGIINNAVKLYANLYITNDNNLNTNITVNYTINSFILNDLNDKINFHIQNKLENYYIKNIDNYFLHLKK